MNTLSIHRGYQEIALKLFLLLGVSFYASILCAEPEVFRVTDFGAVGDGVTVNTQAIQAAIDSCARKGGGTVVIPKGTFLSGTIYLKNGVNIHLEQGATLLGSPNVEDYPLNTCNFPSYSDSYVGRALIWGENLSDVGITGHGKIDGQGVKFRDNRPDPDEWANLVAFYRDTTRYRPEPGYINRPYLIRFISCRNVRIEDVTLLNSPMWMQQYLNCDFVRIQNITVYNHGSRNNDMIDIDCSRNVIISGCYGDSADDGITLKSTGPLPTENVTISDCVVSSFCNAIKMGTESSGGFKNITISNCVIRPSAEPNVIYGRAEGLAGLALEIVDGGSLDGVTISNISMKGTTAPIFMRLGNRARPSQPNLPSPAVGAFRNVIVSNIAATAAGNTGCSITGIPDQDMENVTLSNIKIHFVGGGSKEQSEAVVPEHEKKYPESTMFGVLPSYGFYCRHVNGLSFRDVTLSYEQPDQRPAFIGDDVENLKVDNLNAQVETNVLAEMVFRNVRGAMITHCNPTATTFLRLQDHCENITLIGNDFSRVREIFSRGETTPKSAVYVSNNRR